MITPVLAVAVQRLYRRAVIMSDDAAFDALLDHLRLTRGFDFSAYKRSSLMRRIEKRMGTVGAILIMEDQRDVIGASG
jgi:CheR methyltransferase, all-alpha domain